MLTTRKLDTLLKTLTDLSLLEENAAIAIAALKLQTALMTKYKANRGTNE